MTRLSGHHAVVLTPDKASLVKIKQQFQPTSFWAWLKKHFDYTQHDTVSHFISSQERWLNAGRNVLPHHVVFIDQATLLSSKQMHDVIHITRQTGARLIVIDDAKAPLPWQTGAPFIQLLQHGVTQAKLTQHCRQQHETLKAALADTRQGNMNAAFEKIGHRILSVKNKEERLERMADHYASLEALQQKKAQVVMPTVLQCEEMNLLIRNKLKQQQGIDKAGISITVYLPKYLSQTACRIAKSYTVGQWIRFNAPFKSLGVQQGEYCEIKLIQQEHNVIVLENASGKSFTWNPDKVGTQKGTIEVFETKTREIAVGDRLVWKRNHLHQALHKGERLQVTAIANHRLQLTRENGKALWISLKEIPSQHFDYGYATPIHQIKANHHSILIAYQNSFSRQSHQRLFYKILSQATEQVWIYTEAKSSLLNLN